MKTYLGRVIYPSTLPDEVTLWGQLIANDEVRKILADGVIPYAGTSDRFILNWVQELFDLSLQTIKRPTAISIRRNDRILIPRGTRSNLRFQVFEVIDDNPWGIP